MGTIIVVLILTAVVTVIIAKMIKDRKKGKTCCGFDCCSCSASCSKKNNCSTEGKNDQKCSTPGCRIDS